MVNGPSFDLTEKVALITGAGRGIGLAIARALASAGCAIAIQDIDLQVAQAEADKMNNEGGQAVALGGDINDLSLPPKLVEQTLVHLGGIHILVNNASIQATMPWTKVDQTDFDRTMHANVLFPIMLCQQVEPIFRRQEWGRVLNIGSIQQKYGNEHMLSYAMSKSALESLTLALSRDLAPHATVNCIAPGYYNTHRNVKALGSKEGRDRAGEKMPLQRVGEPQDAAGMALLLCSEAGSYITGQTIYVDGGLSAKWW